jgi:hypothetical protein
MREARFIPLLVLLLALPIFSCSGDDNPTKPKESPYKTLFADGPRDNVLNNLQQSYNDRNISRYEELLDADFIFYFSAADVSRGIVSAEYWSRAAEINVSKNMFDPNYSNPNQEPVKDIDLSLIYPGGDDQWTQITPEDQVKYAGETWYQKIVTYNLTVQLPGNFQYVGLNKQTAFVVRAATRDSKQYWQIVIWRDDTGTNYRQFLRRGETVGIAQDTTWGSVKAQYGD